MLEPVEANIKDRHSIWYQDIYDINNKGIVVGEVKAIKESADYKVIVLGNSLVLIGAIDRNKEYWMRMQRSTMELTLPPAQRSHLCSYRQQKENNQGQRSVSEREYATSID